MPELPEVERARRLVEDYCKNKKIVECVVQEQGGGPRTGQQDDIIFPNDTAEVNTALPTLYLVLPMRRRRGAKRW